jgi:N,N-dimethylformamidase
MDKVRGGLVYFDAAGEGAVVAAGSIKWVGGLAWKYYDNNAPQITANTLHELLKRCCTKAVEDREDGRRDLASCYWDFNAKRLISKLEE